MKGVKDYDGTNDAETILETILCRKNWTSAVRDELKTGLEIIVAKQIRQVMRFRS